MDSNERILKTLSHKEPDRVPVDLGTTNSTGIAVIAYKKWRNELNLKPVDLKVGNIMQQLAAVDEDVLEIIRCDTRSVAPYSALYDIKTFDDGSTYYYDEWGIGWRKSKDSFYYDLFHNPLDYVKSLEDVKNHKWTAPEIDYRMRGINDRIEKINKGNKAVFLKGFVPGVMEFAAWLRGYEQFFVDMYCDPDIAKAILHKSFEVKAEYWETVLKTFGSHVNVVNESDDLGTQRAPLISVDMYREWIKPLHKELIDIIKKHSNAKVFLHSCGSVKDFIPDMINTGFDILNPVQYNAHGMDLVELKREYGNDIVFWGGGIDTQKVLPFSTVSEVKDAVTRNVEILKKNGGFVFAQVHNIQADVPPENICAMYEAFEKCADY
jgi:uroporphyrinogen decarboxylase